jgi:hypothetical protein
MQLYGTRDPEQFMPGDRVQVAGFIAAARWKFGQAMYTPHPEGWPMMGVVAERGRFRAWGRLPRPFARAALRATESSGRQDLNPDDELAYAWLTGQRVSFTATVKRWRHLDGMLFYTNPQKAELTALAAPAVRADLAERLPEGSFIYIVTDSNPDAVKIGKTSNLSQRLSTLQTASSRPLQLLALLPGDYDLENALHRRLAEVRLHGEWFQRTPEIEALIAARGFDEPVSILSLPARASAIGEDTC